MACEFLETLDNKISRERRPHVPKSTNTNEGCSLAFKKVFTRYFEVQEELRVDIHPAKGP